MCTAHTENFEPGLQFLSQLENCPTVASCGVCACWAAANNLCSIPLSNMRDFQVLEAGFTYPFTITNGMVLYPEGVAADCCQVCETCIHSLVNSAALGFALNKGWQLQMSCLSFLT